MLTFDRASFSKNINLNAKSKVVFDTNWETVLLENLADFQSGLWKGEKGKLQTIKVLRNTNFKSNNGKLSYDDVAEIEVEQQQLNDRQLKYGDIILEKSGGSDTQAIGRIVIFDRMDNEAYSFSNFCSRIRVKNENIIKPLYLWLMLNDFYNKGGTIPLQKGIRLLNIDLTGYKKIKIPLPPLKIQEKIVSEIEVLEKKEYMAKKKIEESKKSIVSKVSSAKGTLQKVSDLAEELFAGGDLPKDNYSLEQTEKYNIPIYANAVEKDGLYGFTNIVKVNEKCLTISARGTIGFCKIRETPFYPIVRLLVLIPKKEIAELKYLEYAIGRLDLKQFGASIPQLTVPQLSSFEIPLPPLSEQKKIVAEIEKLEARIDDFQIQLTEISKQKEAVLLKYL
jgi:type I restriction enzyme M protein